jgi:4a-hydroxytetrahydrobiopterin dehydratase
MTELKNKRCAPCNGEVEAMPEAKAEEFLKDLEDWSLSADGKMLSKDFKFKGFYKTMAFVNSIAWIANQEVHHPDLEIGYGHCHVHYTTHEIDGLSINDFICAAKIDALLKP